MEPIDIAQHIADHYENDIYCFAPGENSTPTSVFNKEAECFPTLFPNGKNTFNEKDRKYKITFAQYARSRLFSTDSRYARNPPYIFYLQYVKEFREVLQSAKISLRKTSPTNSKGQQYTAGMLTDAQNIRNFISNNEGYKFMKSVRGTAAYWEKQTKHLFAMVAQRGIPTWFNSFSAADQRWTEITEAILEQEGKPVPDNLTWEEHCQVINRNPVTAASMFDQRTHHLLNDLIKSPANPIGEVIDFYYRIEFQQRGI